jgi:mitochondrial enoyl-[acyl-carrier protein] reductase / trans-2-enoyl-CoA reductase
MAYLCGNISGCITSITQGRQKLFSPVAAATISVNPFTADRMMFDFVDLKKRDWVVQNDANSGVEQNVIQLARI